MIIVLIKLTFPNLWPKIRHEREKKRTLQVTVTINYTSSLRDFRISLRAEGVSRRRCGASEEKAHLGSHHLPQQKKLLKGLMPLVSPPLLQVRELPFAASFFKFDMQMVYFLQLLFLVLMGTCSLVLHIDVAGASSGIGTETARVLALRGAHVVMAVRNMAAGKDAREQIVKAIPTAKVDAMELDLSSLSSVRKFASDFNSSGLPLNILM